MKFGQLTEYNTVKVSYNFLEKSYTKSGGETSHRLFSKTSKLCMSLDQQSKVLYSFFFIVWQVENYQNIYWK